MPGNRLKNVRLQALWLTILAVPALLVILALAADPNPGEPAPWMLFTVVVIAASLCVVTSLLVLNRARKLDQCELGYLGLFFFASSCLPLVHGITTAGAVFGSNSATVSSIFWTIPVAVLVGLPAVMQRHELRARIDAHWKAWAKWSIAFVVSLSAMLIIEPDLLPMPEPDSRWTWGVAGASFGACGLWAYRHLELAIIARSAAPLTVAAAYGLVGSSALFWLSGEPYSLAFWTVHAFDIGGVFLGTIGALVVYLRTGALKDRLEPILMVDPRGALELGVDPLVHRFIADLEAKDAITRDHVVRTTELAMSIAKKLGLDAELQREVGLAALLHDIGKLVIPDALLNKPGPLTEKEYEIMKRHANYGADMLLESPPLAAIAPAVRAHHERIDGSGYPLGLRSTQIPLVARIVAACDGYDAMANTRQYRAGLSVDMAIDTLERNAGSQWDRRVIETLVRHLRHSPPKHMPEILDAIGRIGCDCIPHPESLSTDATPLYGTRDGYPTESAKAS